MPGPVPNRSTDLSRDRDANRSDRPDLKKGTMRPVEIPEPDPEWHPLAKMVYDGMKNSGQADFFQESDWAYAHVICEELSHYKSQTRRSGQMFSSLSSAMTNMLLTEADRRRARIELEEEPVESLASVSAIDSMREELDLG